MVIIILFNMTKSRLIKVKAFLYGRTASNQWDSNLGWYNAKACAMNCNLVSPETFLDFSRLILPSTVLVTLPDLCYQHMFLN